MKKNVISIHVHVNTQGIFYVRKENKMYSKVGQGAWSFMNHRSVIICRNVSDFKSNFRKRVKAEFNVIM